MQHKAKKSLGQNFLHSGSALSKICHASDLSKNDLVLEIGPGKGALTKKILETGASVIAIEKDNSLIESLKTLFSQEILDDRLLLVHGDVLEENLNKLVLSEKNISDGNFKLIANIPYYITGEILRLFIGGNIKPRSATLLVQKEVADRILARDGKGSILSMSIKPYGEVSYIAKVGKNSFRPVPKVDSAIIHIENISMDFFNDISEENYFRILKTGFAHKRKKLIGNLSSIAKSEDLKRVFESIGLKDNSRAEELKLKDWQKLSAEIQQTIK